MHGSGEQRVQIDPRDDVQVRRQVASAADGRDVAGDAQLCLRARQLGDSGGLSQLLPLLIYFSPFRDKAT